MITGNMTHYNETSVSLYKSQHTITTEEIAKNIQDARAQGFIIGAKVVQVFHGHTGTVAPNVSVGEIIQYNVKPEDAIDGLGEATPLKVKWTYGSFNYSTDSLVRV